MLLFFAGIWMHISRKQGAKRRNVLAHVTELSNAVDEEIAPNDEQKKPPKVAEPPEIPQ